MRNILVLYYWTRNGSRSHWTYRRTNNGAWMCEVSQRFVSRTVVLEKLRECVKWKRT